MTDNEPQPKASVHEYEIGVTTRLDREQKERLADFLRSMAEERNIDRRGYGSRLVGTVSLGMVIGYTGLHHIRDLSPEQVGDIQNDLHSPGHRVVVSLAGDLT